MLRSSLSLLLAGFFLVAIRADMTFSKRGNTDSTRYHQSFSDYKQFVEKHPGYLHGKANNLDKPAYNNYARSAYSSGDLRSLLPKDIFLGGAVTTEFLQDSAYDKCLIDHYSVLTPTWEMKMKDTYNGKYEMADRIISFASSNGMRIRGHTTIWKESRPDNAPRSKADVLAFVTRSMKHFGPHIISMDVVNEIFDDDGSGFKNTWLYDLGGEELYTEAFVTANRAAPGVKLFLNEYGAESSGKKRQLMYDTVKKWKNNKVAIHGVGLQCHFIAGKVPKELGETIKMFRDLGVEVVLSELDISVAKNASPAQIEQQAKDFVFVFEACIKNGCKGITLWGASDKDSWVTKNIACQYDQGHCGMTNPLLFDYQCRPKKAQQAVFHALSTSRH